MIGIQVHNTLVAEAARAASRTRLGAGLTQKHAICPYDLCDKLGLALWFQAAPSLEGVYIAGPEPLVIVSALRPSGRQRVTCAHEIGHHVFGHGSTLDEYGSTEFSSTGKREEFLVNAFAEYLLIPKTAMLLAIRNHRMRVESMAEDEALALANYFGVGYRTLIHHMERNLALLPSSRAAALRRLSPKQIRHKCWPDLSPTAELVVAKKPWFGRPIDLHVGDTLLLPPDAVQEGDRISLILQSASERAYVAAQPGIGRVETASGGWAAYLRVARRHPEGGFVGRGIYRFEDDDE